MALQKGVAALPYVRRDEPDDGRRRPPCDQPRSSPTSRTSEGPQHGPSTLQSKRHFSAQPRSARASGAPVAPQTSEALPGALLPALQQHLLDREVVGRPGLEADARAAGTGSSRSSSHATTFTSPARVRFLPGLLERLDGRPGRGHAVDVVDVVRVRARRVLLHDLPVELHRRRRSATWDRSGP